MYLPSFSSQSHSQPAIASTDVIVVLAVVETGSLQKDWAWMAWKMTFDSGSAAVGCSSACSPADSGVVTLPPSVHHQDLDDDVLPACARRICYQPLPVLPNKHNLKDGLGQLGHPAPSDEVFPQGEALHATTTNARRRGQASTRSRSGVCLTVMPPPPTLPRIWRSWLKDNCRP